MAEAPLGRKPDLYASRMALNDDEGIGRRRGDGDWGEVSDSRLILVTDLGFG